MRPRADGWTGSFHGIMGTGRFGTSRPDPTAAVGRTSISQDPERLGTAPDLFDERAVVRAVLDGDRDAFRRLVERESPTVVRACHRILGDHAEAEDASQEAFVTAYRSLATWRGDGPFGAWVTRIGVRIALRMAGKRRTVSWRHPSGADRDSAASAVSSAADRAADRQAVAATSWTDPAVLSMRAERATEIRTAVTSLPEPYRETVALRFFAEASLDEIARQTGRPLGTVKTHLHRGLARLRASLDEGTDR